MERELLITGIGGQGVQLAAQVLARGATLEGREVMYLGLYGGMMRGGNTDSTVVVADAPILAPPVVSHAWSAIAMHDDYWPASKPSSGPVASCSSTTRRSRATIRADVTVHRVAATDGRHRARQPAVRIDGDARRVLRDHAASSPWTRSSRRCARRSRRTGRSTSKRTNARCAPGGSSCPPTRSRPGRPPVSESRDQPSRAAAPSPSTSSTARAAISASPRARRRCSRCRRR